MEDQTREDKIISDTKQPTALIYIPAANEALDGSGNPFVFSTPPYPLGPIINLHSTPIRLPSLSKEEILLFLLTTMQY